MAAKCDMCAKMAKRYSTMAGTIVCSKTCLNAYNLQNYLLRIEEQREKEEITNITTYQQARELSAWLSIWKNGNVENRKRAARIINSF